MRLIFTIYTRSHTYIALSSLARFKHFGALFSLAFAASPPHSRGALRPTRLSLGTSFTLARYARLDGAATYGVPGMLFRVNVELGDAGWLHRVFADALKVTKDAKTNARG